MPEARCHPEGAHAHNPHNHRSLRTTEGSLSGRAKLSLRATVPAPHTVSANLLCIPVSTTRAHAETRRTRRRGESVLFSAPPRPPRLRVRPAVELSVHSESW